MSEKIIIVDDQDHALGVEEKMAVHEQGLLHRAFSVFVYRDKAGEPDILLQRRHPEKYHCGNLWTNACCGHPREHETILDAATRRLKEETGLLLSLSEVGVFHYIAHFDNGLIENEIDHVFIAPFTNETIDIHPQEIAELKWQTLSDLGYEMDENPATFTPWLKPALDIAAPTMKKELK
jgi:isopentenyl-diphosphate Delta-isomerase